MSKRTFKLKWWEQPTRYKEPLSFSIWLALFNLQAFPLMPQNKVEDDVDTVSKYAPSVIMWQEAWWALRYIRTIQRYFNKKLYRHIYFLNAGGCGITFDRNIWGKVRVWNSLVHKVWPYLTAERRLVEVLLLHRKTGLKVAFISGHAAPWRKGKGKKAQERFNKRLKKRILWFTRYGIPVVAGVDANQKGYFIGKLIDDKHKITYAQGTHFGGIDKYLFVEADGFKWGFPTRKEIVPMKSDHDLVLIEPYLFYNPKKGKRRK